WRGEFRGLAGVVGGAEFHGDLRTGAPRRSRLIARQRCRSMRDFGRRRLGQVCSPERARAPRLQTSARGPVANGFPGCSLSNQGEEMANPYRGEVRITVDGRERTMRLT